MVAAAATATLLATSGKGAGQESEPATSALSWAGLVGSRPRVATGGRVIILLRTPSLAQRVLEREAGAAEDHQLEADERERSRERVVERDGEGVEQRRRRRRHQAFSAILRAAARSAGGALRP